MKIGSDEFLMRQRLMFRLGERIRELQLIGYGKREIMARMQLKASQYNAAIREWKRNGV